MSDSKLERNLGLPETIAISMGSMIGSGIFILPGVAFIEVGNASVVLAFLVGGLLTLPAALSAAEMATAIPESGGSYTYIQRGMGPVMGTVAGVGNWMVLNFKTALALIGGLPYLVYLFPRISELGSGLLDPVIVLAVGLTVLFTALNTLSSDGAGKAQNIIVVLMMIALLVVIVASAPTVATTSPEGLFGVGGGFLAATSLVFVAYAGVIKVTSVAEEVKNPDRNIPLGIGISLAVTTIVYVAITYIAVVTLDISNLVQNVPVSQGGLAPNGEGAILAIAAETLLGPLGAIMIVAAALLALASTANSGILSASRYPLAMARDGLTNRQFSAISRRTGTPIYSVLATGGAVVFMVVFLPVDSVARFGAAFQIIVFMLVSLAVIGFREANPEEYNPTYLSPAYPYLQLFGVGSGALLLTQLGPIAFVGTIVITLLSIAYYYFYARPRFRSEGSVKTELRERLSTTAQNQTESLLNREGTYRVLIALWGHSGEIDIADAEHDLLDVIQTLNSHGLDVEIDVVEFVESRRESFNAEHPDIDTGNPDWVKKHEAAQYRKVSASNVNEAIVEYATYNGIDLITHEFKPDKGRVGVVDDDLEWVVENAPCDSVALRGESSGTVEKVTVVSEGAHYVPTKMLLADAMGAAHTAPVELVHLVSPGVDEERQQAEEYLNTARDNMVSPASVTIVETDEPKEEAVRRSRDADVLIAQLDIDTIWRRFSPAPVLEAAFERDGTTLLVYSDELLEYRTIYRRILMRYIFRGLD